MLQIACTCSIGVWCHVGEEKCVYSAFGASCSEVEVNMLTGERRVLRADIMMDAGNSLSPAIDAGQVHTSSVLLSSDTCWICVLRCHLCWCCVLTLPGVVDC